MTGEQPFSRVLWGRIGHRFASILAHPFITGLTDGSLDREAFRFYVVQDAHYLREYARALAIAAARAPAEPDIAMFARHAAEALEVERSLHEGILAELGLDGEEVAATPMAPTNLAYTSYLLAVAYGGSFPEALGALLPCYWIYWEVGRALAERGSPDPLYRRWIETYGGEDFGAVVRAVLALTDRVGAALGAAERERVAERFVTTSRYEWMFWDMGLRRERWPDAASDPVDDLVARALAEDLGAGDVTAQATVPAAARARAVITQKAPGVIFGLDPAARVFLATDPGAIVTSVAPEGVWRDGGEVLEIEGTARGILAAERTALNLLGRLSGVATLTARHVRAVAGAGARILDTRKTTPGLRALEKAAVAAGGGVNHRRGLYDAVLIKENHAAMAGGVGEAVRRARQAFPGLPLEVECRTPAEVDEAVAAGAPRILLDNMDPPALRAAVERIAGRAETEASGGISLETIGEVAATGVDFVSVGALTHSAPALDLSLLLEPRP